MKIKYPHEKIWAVFEPRSNTTRRNVFQHDLPLAFSEADAVVIAEVARLEQIPMDQRLDPKRLMEDLVSLGKTADYLPDADAIVAHLGKAAEPGDVVCVFSNGGFGGIHQKLLDRFSQRR
jgi:UDP-N-acetylmuramate: L-alanyl-gamma-D-glutamyl-meso-diaminopimelate ligase